MIWFIKGIIGVMIMKLKCLLCRPENYVELYEGIKDIVEDKEQALKITAHAVSEVGYNSFIIPERWHNFNYWGIIRGGNYEKYRCFICGLVSYLSVLKEYYPNAYRNLGGNITDFVNGLRDGILGGWTADPGTYYKNIIIIYDKLKNELN